MARQTALLLVFLAASARAFAAERDPRAEAVGREMIAAIGGEAAFEKARQLRFDFVIQRGGAEAGRFRHAWDRDTGDYRVEGTDKAGAPWAVYFNVNSREGKAFHNGRPAEGEASEKLLTDAYRRFINDTYWFLAPWKIFDPGVNLGYDGEKPCGDGATCDVVKVSFENVGLTPKDLYWLWITRPERRMIQWQYVLGGAQEEPATALWKDWQRIGGIGLSLEKEIRREPPVAIRFENVSVSPARDDSLFRPPAAP